MVVYSLYCSGSVFNLMSAEDRDRLKRVTELAKQKADGQQLLGNSESGKTPAVQHPGQPQLQSDTSSKFSVERMYLCFVVSLVFTLCYR